MDDVSAVSIQFVLHNDDENSAGICRCASAFGVQNGGTDAFRITEKVNEQGRAICGTSPLDVADELLEAVRERIRAAGQPLLITSRAVADGRCKLCSRLFSDNSCTERRGNVCDDCIHEITGNPARSHAAEAIQGLLPIEWVIFWEFECDSGI